MPSPPDPDVPTRYAATSEDGTVHIWCREHVAEPILSYGDDSGLSADDMQAVIAEHDRQHHEEDRVV